jgi:hypothetical protein
LVGETETRKAETTLCWQKGLLQVESSGTLAPGGEAEVECGAMTELTINSDVALMFFHNSLGNSQS